jgi:hypothetical protein
MSNITTDFITATKKIHADVRAVLAALHLIGDDVKTIRDKNSTCNNQSEPTEEHQGASVIRSANKKPNSYEAKQYALEKLRFRMEKKAFCVGIWTVVILGIYTVLTGYQSCQTQKAADATTRAADTAEKNFAFTQSEFRMEQRPYLSPVPRPAFAKPASNGIDIGRPFAVLMEKGGDTLSIAVDLRNIGKSPANNSVLTRMEYIFGERDKARQGAKRYQPSYESVPNVVAPGEFITPSSPKLPMTKQQADWFLKGEWELYIVGAVRYTDIFAPPIGPYETTYCFKVRPSGMSYANCDWRPPDFTSSIK